MMKRLLTLMVIYGLAGCAMEPQAVAHKHTPPDTLTVHNDGTMEFRNHLVSQDDVVIYPDGFGGERAAIKVHVPYKKDFYRDTIRVHRIDAETTITQN